VRERLLRGGARTLISVMNVSGVTPDAVAPYPSQARGTMPRQSARRSPVRTGASGAGRRGTAVTAAPRTGATLATSDAKGIGHTDSAQRRRCGEGSERE